METTLTQMRNALEAAEQANAAVLEALDVALEARHDEMQRLEAARQLLTHNQRTRKATSRKPAAEKQSKRTAKRSAEKLGTRSEQRKARLDKAQQRHAKLNGKVKKGERKVQVQALLKKGVAPKAVAEQLGTHVNYVYTVKRAM